VNRQEWRSKGKRYRRRTGKPLIEQICQLYMSGHSIKTISSKTGCPEMHVRSILENLDKHLRESVEEGEEGGGG
jgi:hypothetical protein